VGHIDWVRTLDGADIVPLDPGAASAPLTAAIDPSDTPEPTRAEMFKQIAAILKREGTTRDDVMTITIPRDDLSVTVDGQDVPTAAGIESQFRFYQCPCGGKISVIGSFVTADYEANDVVDSLREGHLVVSSVGPFLAYEHPRLTLVRFQGEAKAEDLGSTLKKALEWTGERRGKPERLKE
jgi:hypothetical protein